MKRKTHVGYNVSDLSETLKFYKEVLNASVEFINVERKSASLLIGGCELNLFEAPEFGGYHASLLKSLHIGFQLSSREMVNAVYEKAQKMQTNPIGRPNDRFDGDYALFLKDPDGMAIEVFYGNHQVERDRFERGRDYARL